MPKIDHITYQVPIGSLVRGDERGPLGLFLEELGFRRVDVEEDIPEGWTACWYRITDGRTLKDAVLHFVEAPNRAQPMTSWMGYGHICLVVDDSTFRHFKDGGEYLERDSGSGRLWLNCRGFRVELRSFQRAVQPSGQVDEDPPTPSAGLEQPAGHHRTPIEEVPRPIETLGLPQRIAGDFVDLDISSIKDPQLRVFARALAVYGDREKKYKEHWKRYGWRGALSELRKAAERAWHLLWNKNPAPFGENQGDDIDDLLDVINYAAFAIRAVEDGNRDGEGGWW